MSATTLPSQGTLTGTALVLNGFSVNGQYTTITATQDGTATHLNGTYSVRGGCAANATGTVTGTRYDALTGTYRGPVTGGQTLAITTTQNPYPDGTGYFTLTGSATFTGTTCLTSATLDSDASYVIGSSVSIALVSPNGIRLTLNGKFSPDAASMTLTSIKVSSGSCADTFGTGNLLR